MSSAHPHSAGEPVHVREYRRGDREQLTALVNAHISAVVPGGSVSVQGMLSSLEDEPAEYIVNPWIVRRATLVAEQRDRLVAAAHLVVFGGQAPVSAGLRHTGEIRFLVYWPPSPLFPDTGTAARDLMVAIASRFAAWGITSVRADGTLPAPGIFGVPEQWPHVRQLYREHGFATPTRSEVVLLALIRDIARPIGPYVAVRSVGMSGTRIDALADCASSGYIEVDTTLDSGPRMSRFGAWADVGNLGVSVSDRDGEVRRWLLGQAAEWLELAGVTHLFSYCDPADRAESQWWLTVGFRVLTTVDRGYTRGPRP